MDKILHYKKPMHMLCKRNQEFEAHSGTVFNSLYLRLEWKGEGNCCTRNILANQPWGCQA